MKVINELLSFVKALTGILYCGVGGEEVYVREGGDDREVESKRFGMVDKRMKSITN